MGVTYHRYKAALQKIASGTGDAVSIAAEALRDPRQPKSVKSKPIRKKLEDMQAERLERAIAIFEYWHNEKPTYRELGKEFGISKHAARRRVQHAIWRLLHPERATHRLHKAACSAREGAIEHAVE